MRILLAGATGAIGQSLTPALVAAGHVVHGTTRTDANAAAVEAAGATPVIMDGLDHASVLRAVDQAEPDVIIHELTSLKTGMNPKRIGHDFAVTDRLRTEGTDNLLEAARARGVGRFIAQSFTGWTNAVTGPNGTRAPADETEPLDPSPAKESREMMAAIRHLETAVTGAADLEGLVLRYGAFYGPGTGLARDPDGETVELVRGRKLPIVGKGGGVWSFIHTVDAASATVAAVEHGRAGCYNIVDDDPAPMSEWLPALASALGAKPPRHIPVWLSRPLLGEFGVRWMTAARGSSNAKAKRELGWTLRYPSWRLGFATGL